MSPFSAPFSGAPPSERPLLPRRSRLHSGRDPRRSGGTGKAEAVQCFFCIPHAGPRAQEFGSKPCLENGSRKKEQAY